MKSNNKSAVFLWAAAAAAAVVVVAMSALLRAEAAAPCNVLDLAPCAPAILGSAAPTGLCCSLLKAHSSCFCQYEKDPTLRKYFTGGKKVAAACGVTIPACSQLSDLE